MRIESEKLRRWWRELIMKRRREYKNVLATAETIATVDVGGRDVTSRDSEGFYTVVVVALLLHAGTGKRASSYAIYVEIYHGTGCRHATKHLCVHKHV